MLIKDKNIIITGAANGLGKALANKLIPISNNAVLIDKDIAGLESLKSQFTDKVVAIPTDLSNIDDILAIKQKLNGQCTKYDLLINCAGIGSHKLLEDLTAAEIDKLVTINCTAPIALTSQLLADRLLNVDARIVNIGSISGHLNLPGMSLYSASKSFFHSFSKSMRTELKQSDISVLLVVLGSLSDTNFGKNLQSDYQNKVGFYANLRISAAIAAEKIVEAIGTNKKELVIPKYLKAALFFERHMPWLTELIKQKAFERLTKTAPVSNKPEFTAVPR